MATAISIIFPWPLAQIPLFHTASIIKLGGNLGMRLGRDLEDTKPGVDIVVYELLCTWLQFCMTGALIEVDLL